LISTTGENDGNLETVVGLVAKKTQQKEPFGGRPSETTEQPPQNAGVGGRSQKRGRGKVLYIMRGGPRPRTSRRSQKMIFKGGHERGSNQNESKIVLRSGEFLKHKANRLGGPRLPRKKQEDQVGGGEWVRSPSRRGTASR